MRATLQVGVHNIQFLVDGEWHVCKDLPETQDDKGRECNELTVTATATFAIFYKSGWEDVSLLSRHLGADGQPLTEVWSLTQYHPRLGSVSGQSGR